ncbi:MAG: hypothetical protein LCI03_09565 [Actinobacteria bacterium]|nr:hypothetical protein [Actinomycetota bacterium]
MTDVTQEAAARTAQALERSVPVLAAVRLGLAALCAVRPGESRLVGARELALGLGTLDARRRGAPTSGWVAAMAVSDGGDALAFLGEAVRPDPEGMAGGSRSKALWLAAFGASGLVAEGLTAYALRRRGL